MPSPTKARWQSLLARLRRRPRLSQLTRRRLRRAAPLLLLLLLAVLALEWLAGTRTPPRFWPRPQILAAIRFVESSDRQDPPDGDDGRAIGPFQIHAAYWADAQGADPGLGGSYQDCRRRAYAERVVAAYMQRYAPEAWARGEAEVIARVHNGGPGGQQLAATLPYWHRVLDRLQRGG